MSRNKLNGAQVIVDYLIQEKVPQVFGLCGHGNIQFIDALYERQQTSRPSRCTTRASRASWPTSIIAYRAADRDLHVVRAGLGEFADLARQCLSQLGAVHGGDRQRADQPVQPRRVPGNVPALPGRLSLHRALLCARRCFSRRAARWCRLRSGRPGRPCDAGVPGRWCSMCRSTCSWSRPPRRRRTRRNGARNISSRCGADPEGVVKAVDMLLAAERPVMIVGQGVRYGGAATELRKLAERLQIPVASSASGLGAIDTNHPLALGLVARGGHYQANHATRQADVLLAIGVRFDDRTSSSWIPATPSPFRRRNSSMSTSTPRRSAATIRSRSA